MKIFAAIILNANGRPVVTLHANELEAAMACPINVNVPSWVVETDLDRKLAARCIGSATSAAKSKAAKANADVRWAKHNRLKALEKENGR